MSCAKFNITQDTPNKIKKKIKGNYGDNKATMMALAIHELTAQYQGDIAILFADDTLDHLKGAEQAVADYKQDSQNIYKVFLTTCHMPTSFKKSSEPKAKETYKDSLRKFNIQAGIFDTLIDAEITRLSPDKKETFFTFSSTNKIKALEELKDRLQSASQDTTYGRIIEDWEKEIKYRNGFGQLVNRATMINSHRNFFSTYFSFSNTATGEFIERLKSNYGYLQGVNVGYVEESLKSGVSR